MCAMQMVSRIQIKHCDKPHSSSKMLLASLPKKGTSNLSNVSAAKDVNNPSSAYEQENSPSRYALKVKKPIPPRSSTNMNQERNELQEKIKCSTKMAENSSADCQAWNLYQPLLATILSPTISIEISPNVITLLLQNKQQHSPRWRQQQVCQACFVVQSNRQARLELVQSSSSALDIVPESATSIPECSSWSGIYGRPGIRSRLGGRCERGGALPSRGE